MIHAKFNQTMKPLQKMIRAKTWKFFSLLFVLGISTLLTACLNDDDDNPLPPAAYVSFYHGSPDAPGLDIFVDGRKINNNPLNYNETLPYQPFFLGKRNFRFTPPNAVNSLLDSEITFEADKTYSIFISDLSSNLKTLVLEDDWETPTANNAKIRFVHLSPDAADIEVEISGTAGPFGDTSDFLNASDFVNFEKGVLDITVKSKITNEILVSANDVEIKGKRVYTLVLRGQKSQASGDKQLSLQLLTNFIQF